jgi:hypothetical protein
VPVEPAEAELSAQLVDLAEEISRMEELHLELQSKRQMQLRLIATWWNCGTLVLDFTKAFDLCLYIYYMYISSIIHIYIYASIGLYSW